MGSKITLAEAMAQAADRLLVYCAGRTPDCHHHGEITISEAVERFGADVRLDDLPLRCSACGRAVMDVRPGYPRGRWGGAKLPD